MRTAIINMLQRVGSVCAVTIVLVLLLLVLAATVAAATPTATIVLVPDVAPSTTRVLSSESINSTTMFLVANLGAGATLVLDRMYLEQQQQQQSAQFPIVVNVSSAGDASRIVFNNNFDVAAGLYLWVRPQRWSDVVAVEVDGSRIRCTQSRTTGMLCGGNVSAGRNSSSVATASGWDVSLRIEVATAIQDVPASTEEAAAAAAASQSRGQVAISIRNRAQVSLVGPQDDSASKAGFVYHAAVLVTLARNDIPGAFFPVVNFTLSSSSIVTVTGFGSGGSSLNNNASFPPSLFFAIGVAVGTNMARWTASSYVNFDHSNQRWWDVTPRSRRSWDTLNGPTFDPYHGGGSSNGNSSSAPLFFQMMQLGAFRILSRSSIVIITPASGVGVAVSRCAVLDEFLVNSSTITVASTNTAFPVISALDVHAMQLVELDGGGDAGGLAQDWWDYEAVPGFDKYEDVAATTDENSNHDAGAGGGDSSPIRTNVIPADAAHRKKKLSGAKIVVANTMLNVTTVWGSGLLNPARNLTTADNDKRVDGIRAIGVQLVAVDYFASFQMVEQSHFHGDVFAGSAYGVHVLLARHVGLFRIADVSFRTHSAGGKLFAGILIAGLAYSHAVVVERVWRIVLNPYNSRAEFQPMWCFTTPKCGLSVGAQLSVRYVGLLSLRQNRYDMLTKSEVMATVFVNSSHIRLVQVRDSTANITSSLLVTFWTILAAPVFNVTRLEMSNITCHVPMHKLFGSVFFVFFSMNVSFKEMELVHISRCYIFVTDPPLEANLGAIQIGAIGPKRYLIEDITFECAGFTVIGSFLTIATPWTSIAEAAEAGSAIEVRRARASFDGYLFSAVWMSVSIPAGDGFLQVSIDDTLRGRKFYTGPLGYVSNFVMRDCNLTVKQSELQMMLIRASGKTLPVAGAAIILQEVAIVDMTLMHNQFVTAPASALMFAAKLMPDEPKVAGRVIGPLRISGGPGTGGCNTLNGAPMVFGDVVRAAVVVDEITGAVVAVARRTGEGAGRKLFENVPVEGSVIARYCGGSMSESVTATASDYFRRKPTRTETNRSRATLTRTNSSEITATLSRAMAPVDASGAPAAAKDLASVASAVSLLIGDVGVALDSSRALSVLAMAQQCKSYWSTNRDYVDSEQRRAAFVRNYLLLHPAAPENFFGIGSGPRVGRYIRGAIVSHIVMLIVASAVSIMFGCVNFFYNCKQKAFLPTPSSALSSPVVIGVLRLSRYPLIVMKTFCFVVSAWTTHAVVLMAAPASLQLPSTDLLLFGLSSIVVWIALPGGVLWIFWRNLDQKPRMWVMEEYLLSFGWRERAWQAAKMQWGKISGKQQQQEQEQDKKSTSRSGVRDSSRSSSPIEGAARQSTHSAPALQGGSSRRRNETRSSTEQQEPATGLSSTRLGADTHGTAAAAPQLSPREQERRDRKQVEKLMRSTIKWNALSAIESCLRSSSVGTFFLGRHVWAEPPDLLRRSHDAPRNVANGAVGGWLWSVGGLVSKQAGPYFTERERQPRTREQRRRDPTYTLEYEHGRLADTLTRRYYHTSRSENEGALDATWWQKLPLLKLAPYSCFISLLWNFLIAVAHGHAIANPADCTGALIFMSVVNAVALIADLTIAPFNANAENAKVFLTSTAISLGSILSAAFAVQVEQQSRTAGPDSPKDITPTESAERVLTASTVCLYTALVAGVVVSAIMLLLKLCLLVTDLSILLRRDVTERLQRISVVTVDALLASDEVEMHSLRSTTVAAQGRREERGEHVRHRAAVGGADAGGVAALGAALL